MRLDFDEELPFRPIGSRFYPALRIHFYSANGSRTTNTLALLDTGADTCVFHEKFATKIGLRLKDGFKERRGSIKPGSGIWVYCHRIRLRIGNGPIFPCEVAFSDEIDEGMTDQLIGRETVFDTLRFALLQGTNKLYVGWSP